MAGLVWRVPTDWAGAWDIDKVFWIGDTVKNLLMAFVATAVNPASPLLVAEMRRVGVHGTHPAERRRRPRPYGRG